MTTTKGERRVGVDFNPSGNELVSQIKHRTAEIIDLIEAIPAHDGEIARCKAQAQTCFEDASMWAVKAATKKPVEAT